MNLAQIQKAEELQQQQMEAEEAERRAMMEAQMAEMEAIQSRRQQAGSWKERYEHSLIIIIIIICISILPWIVTSDVVKWSSVVGENLCDC